MFKSSDFQRVSYISLIYRREDCKISWCEIHKTAAFVGQLWWTLQDDQIISSGQENAPTRRQINKQFLSLLGV